MKPSQSKEYLRNYMRAYRAKGGIRDRLAAERKALGDEIEIARTARALSDPRLVRDRRRALDYKRRNPERVRATSHAYTMRRRSDPILREADLTRSKMLRRIYRSTLSDGYVRQVAALGTPFRPSEIPAPLVGLQRIILKLKRICRHMIPLALTLIWSALILRAALTAWPRK
jgi:hypothetical protein